MKPYILLLFVPFAACIYDKGLVHAVLSRDKTSVRYDLKQHADVEVRDAEGFTPLIRAAANNDANIVAMLLGAHADIEARNHFGETALASAAFKGHKRVVNILLSNRAKVNVEMRV